MKIPVVEGPDVASEPIGAPNVTSNLSGFAEAAQTQTPLRQLVPGVVGTATDVYEHARQEAVAADVTDAETKLQAETNARLYDPQNGLMFKRGDQLFPPNPDGSKQDLGAQAFQDLATARQNIADGLTDTRARRMFMLRSQGQIEATHRSIELHVGEQVQAAKQASLQGLQATSLDALANSYADPVARAQLIAQPEGPIKALALSPEDSAARVAEWRQKANSTVLNQYIANRDWQGAQAYFSQVKDQLGTASAQYEHSISTLQGQVAGDQGAVDIINRNRRPNGFIDDAGVTRDVEAIQPGPVKTALEESTHRYLALEKASEINTKAQFFNAALSSAIKGGGISAVPATVLSWLTDNDPEALARLNTMVKRDENAPPTPQETANYATVLSDIERNPLKYKGMTPAQFTYAIGSQVSPRDQRALLSKFAEAQKKPDFALGGSSAQTVTDLFMKAFSAGKNQKDWTPDQLSLWRDVHDYVEQQANTYVRDHNGKLPQEQELSKWANDKLVKGTVVGGGTLFGDKSGVTQAEAETLPKFQGKQFLQDIPDVERKAITSALKKAGKAKPTEQDIRSLYEQHKAAAQ